MSSKLDKTISYNRWRQTVSLDYSCVLNILPGPANNFNTVDIQD